MARRLADAMCEAFDTATVSAPEIERLEPEMDNEPKDRHVLATAVAAEAEIVVTLNQRDFPRSACEPLAIEAISPDEFLLRLYQLDPAAVQDALVRQAAALSRPPLTVLDIIERLEVTVPEFAGVIKESLA